MYTRINFIIARGRVDFFFLYRFFYRRARPAVAAATDDGNRTPAGGHGLAKPSGPDRAVGAAATFGHH